MDRTWQKFENGVEIDSGTHEVSWEQVRSARNQALSASDWRALKDVTLSVPWRAYRQALRDITEHPDANTAADHWPEAPSDE